MFEENPKRLPEDKFQYVLKILTDNNICAKLEICDSNPSLRIKHCQIFHDEIAKKRGINSSPISETTYKHHKLTLLRQGMVRRIFFSINMDTIPDAVSSFFDKIPQQYKGLYFLVESLWILYYGWHHLLDNNIYLWAEEKGCAEDVDTDYIFLRFEYDRENLMKLIDIFGEDILTDIMNYFPVCVCNE